jgi:hypothetical protein
MLFYQGHATGCQLFEGLPEFSQAGVSHGHGDIAQEAGVFGAAHRGVAEKVAKVRFAEGGQAVEGWREVRIGFVLYFRLPGRLPIPRADVLADVAAEDVIPGCNPIYAGNRGSQLDCEV